MLKANAMDNSVSEFVPMSQAVESLRKDTMNSSISQFAGNLEKLLEKALPTRTYVFEYLDDVFDSGKISKCFDVILILLSSHSLGKRKRDHLPQHAVLHRLLENFKEWTKRRPFRLLASPMQKILAVKLFVGQPHLKPPSIELIIDVFKVERNNAAEEDELRHILMKHVNWENGPGTALEVATWFQYLKVELPFDTFILPLFLSTFRHDLVAPMLDNQKANQQVFLRRLDTLVGTPQGYRLSEARHYAPRCRPSRILLDNCKLRQVCRKLAQRWNLVDASLFSNIVKKDRNGFFRMKILAGYGNSEISEEVLMDYVFAEIQAFHSDPAEMLRLLESRGAVKTAAHLCVAYELKARGPHVQEQAQRLANRGQLQIPPPLYSLERPPSPECPENVVFVNTEARLKKALTEISTSKLLAVDSEFCTLSSAREFVTGSSILSLLQVALEEGKTFLIDFCGIDMKSTEGFPELLDALFGQDSPLLLGFGLKSDLSVLKKQFPDSGLKEVHNVLDIQQFIPKYQSAFPEECFVDPDGTPRTMPTCSLKNAVMYVTGETIDKREQCSLWERRPLRLAQVKYAAEDARVLLRIFRTMKSKANLYNLPWNKWLEESVQSKLELK